MAGAVFAAVMTGIVTNAVLFQKGHHPAPLLGPSSVSSQAEMPAPPPRPARLTADIAPDAAAPTEAPAQISPTPHATATTRVAPVAHAPAKSASHTDPIRNLIATGRETSANPATAKHVVQPVTTTRSAAKSPAPAVGRSTPASKVAGSKPDMPAARTVAAQR